MARCRKNKLDTFGEKSKYVILSSKKIVSIAPSLVRPFFRSGGLSSRQSG
jgi:hypothetical protein